jgi:hypothetical protein
MLDRWHTGRLRKRDGEGVNNKQFDDYMSWSVLATGVSSCRWPPLARRMQLLRWVIFTLRIRVEPGSKATWNLDHVMTFRVLESTNFISFNFIYVQCCTNNGCNFNSTTALANGKQIYLSEYFNYTLLYLFNCSIVNCDKGPFSFISRSPSCN